jgi:hypothetical protein
VDARRWSLEELVKITNSPQESWLMEAEARKSFALGVWVQDKMQQAVDLTTCELNLTVAKIDKFGVLQSKIAAVAEIPEPLTGYGIFKLQAENLDFKPGDYNFTSCCRLVARGRRATRVTRVTRGLSALLAPRRGRGSPTSRRRSRRTRTRTRPRRSVTRRAPRLRAA